MLFVTMAFVGVALDMTHGNVSSVMEYIKNI
jgi:hypothetical protein